MLRYVPFSELLAKVVDNRGKTCPVADRGIPLIATNCVKNSTLYPTFEKVRYVNQETYNTWFRGHPEPGDFIFVCKGSPGQICLVPDPVSFCIAQDMVAIRANPDLVYPSYLFAILRSQKIQTEIQNLHVGSLIPHFKKGDFNKLLIPIPSFEVQKVIGDCNLLIERKIELNRRMNETLEAMAQAIFKDWFVDFGPVRRKAAGIEDPVAILGGMIDDPARASAIAALFPDRFGENGLPEGWVLESVIEQADWINGAAYKKIHFVPPSDGLPVVKIGELKSGISASTGFTNSDLGSRYKINDGELLFSWSGNPDTSIDTFIWAGGPAWLNQHIFAVRPNGKKELAYLFSMLKFLNPTFVEIARDKQTTGLGHVTKEDLKRLQIVISTKDIDVEFDRLASSIFELILNNLLEIGTLAETRDYLLPKLISGEIRVRDAEALIKEAAE